MKKYELAEQDPETGLYRIQALRDIPEMNVSVGDIGGFVASEKNLSQDGTCWIFRDASVDGTRSRRASSIISSCYLEWKAF